mgnify:CR=1 FL=1
MVSRHGDALRVQVATDAGPSLIADVTPDAAVELGRLRAIPLPPRAGEDPSRV